MYTFYPNIKINSCFHLQVTNTHKIYVEECGNPQGLPILVINGPSSYETAYLRRLFDPLKYRIILYDQRGTGRSSPYGELSNNTMNDLLNDLETIRIFLKIDRWALFGNSFGSALSLLYAQTHTDKVLALILRNPFLARRKDIKWLYQKGANFIFPDYWADFVQSFPLVERTNLIQAYYNRMIGRDDLARMSAAKSWALWQARCLTLQPHNTLIDHYCEPHIALGNARIELHYLMNNYFLKENHILNNIDIIHQLKGYIIHGRYDMITPLQSAWDLKKKWMVAELFIVRDAGHSILEPGIIDATILATKQLVNDNGNYA